MRVSPVGEEAEVPLITVTPLRVGGAKGAWFSLARRASDFAVAVFRDGRAWLFPRRTFGEDDECLEGQRIDFSRDKLTELAGLLSSWRAERTDWAAYSGDGLHMKWRGYQPVWYWAAGKEAVEIKKDDERFPSLVKAARRVRLVVPDKTQRRRVAAHRVLVSHLDEPLGVVVRVLDGRCAVFLRHAVVLAGAKWPSDRAIATLAASDPPLLPEDNEIASITGNGGVLLHASDAAVVEAAAADLCGEGQSTSLGMSRPTIER